ncbi:hypothetical protein NE237_009946 [Protea cynaroides]|uniref:Uncharacterized protein n=1 Tax=Protea cynaroides TaxID=273540 RepID=A0A9Q0KYT2_9MAGN|nr:hypothetical protein NE237_009946 [Protea cynaroides]
MMVYSYFWFIQGCDTTYDFVFFDGRGLIHYHDVYDEPTEAKTDEGDDSKELGSVVKPKYEFSKPSKRKGKEIADPNAIKKSKIMPNVSSNKGIIIGSSSPLTASHVPSMKSPPALPGTGEGMREQSEDVAKVTMEADSVLLSPDLLAHP